MNRRDALTLLLAGGSAGVFAQETARFAGLLVCCAQVAVQ